MNRPYVICHMMSSVDGRIDCPMTAMLKGVEEYYTTLAKLEAPSVLSGRVTLNLSLLYLENLLMPKLTLQVKSTSKILKLKAITLW